MESYLQLLPCDVFNHLIVSTKLSATDFLNLYNSSDIIKQKCNHKIDVLLNQILTQTYEIHIPHMMPFECLKYVETTIWNKYTPTTIARSIFRPKYVNGSYDYVIPDSVFHMVANRYQMDVHKFIKMFYNVEYELYEAHLGNKQSIVDNSKIPIIAELKPVKFKTNIHVRYLVGDIILQHNFIIHLKNQYYINNLFEGPVTITFEFYNKIVIFKNRNNVEFTLKGDFVECCNNLSYKKFVCFFNHPDQLFFGCNGFSIHVKYPVFELLN